MRKLASTSPINGRLSAQTN